MYVCMFVYANMYVCTHTRMYVCMYACMHAWLIAGMGTTVEHIIETNYNRLTHISNADRLGENGTCHSPLPSFPADTYSRTHA